MTKALQWVGALLLALLLALVAATRLGGWKLCCVLSGSMEPTLPVGSLVLVRPVQPQTLAAGQIITFAQGELNVTHRILQVNEDGSFTTKGDANDSADGSAVQPPQVQGRVLLCVPWLGYAAAWLSGRARGAALALAAVLAVLALAPRWPTHKHARQKPQEGKA